MGDRDVPVEPGPPAAREGRATSDVVAAALCFVMAIGGVLTVALNVVAKSLVDSSVSDVGDRLPEDARAAIGELSTLNVVNAVLAVVIAVGFVTGGVVLLRRKPVGRAIIAVTCAVQVLAVIAMYVLSSRVWDRIHTAMQDVTSVEVTDVGSGIGSVIARCLFAVVIVLLAYWVVIRPPSKTAAPANDALATGVALPPPSGGAAIAASVLSFVGALPFAVTTVAGVVGGLSDDHVVSAVGAVLSALVTVGLVLGGVMLLRRRHAGRIVIVVSWSVVILLMVGLAYAVTRISSHPARALGRISLVVGPIAVFGVAAIVLALVVSTGRWCDARRAVTITAPVGPALAAEPRTLESSVPAVNAVDEAGIPEVGTAPPWWRRGWVIASGSAAVVVVLVVVGVLAFTGSQGTPGRAAVQPGKVHTFGPQIGLPFPKESVDELPQSIAVDQSGTVYLSYLMIGQRGKTLPAVVRSLAPGASASVVLPFTGLPETVPSDIAVDRAGTVYLVDRKSAYVLRKGASRAEKLRFGNDVRPQDVQARGVAVDDSGTVYVGDGSRAEGGVTVFRAGVTEPTHLPFDGRGIQHLAAGPNGTVYAAYGRDQGFRVMSLEPGAAKPTPLPFTDISEIKGMAVDRDGTVYVADDATDGKGRILALPARGTVQTVLRPTSPTGVFVQGVAVDGAGNVYAYGSFFTDKVIKLPVTG
ncbi:hypothetical protein AXK61_05210 [Tsukamurella pseudospumae]|uniref:SMP-30/Gluconolactonase/LRE-like region domain-containing protein n=1 Tax=Tsukamurella pseudospumae TaxID=239498 RepID=A0A137Z6X4_9ACTN|nr:hypothetical protein AXK61_05210 [Tsukamurella pseudospumae]